MSTASLPLIYALRYESDSNGHFLPYISVHGFRTRARIAFYIPLHVLAPPISPPLFALTTSMAAPVLPPPPTHLCPTRLLSTAGARSTLAPVLLAKTASQTPPRPPPIRSNAPRPPPAVAADQGSKKRKPPLSPSAKDTKKANTEPSPSPSPKPPVACSNVVTMAAERTRALDRKVAGCFLSRNWGATARSEGGTALRCLCRGLPQGTRCALHQDAPGRSWMPGQGGVPLVGGEGVVVVPKVCTGAASAEVFAEYARWRRGVRMPSRFYVEHIRTANAGQKDWRAEAASRGDVLCWVPN